MRIIVELKKTLLIRFGTDKCCWNPKYDSVVVSDIKIVDITHWMSK